MKSKSLAAFVLSFAGLALAFSPAAAQMLPGEQAADIEAISGVISGDAEWELVWADFVTADGIVGTPDGGLLFAQEQTNSVRKLGPDDKEFVFLDNLGGPGSVSMDSQGRVYIVERTCTDPGLHMPSCNELTRVTQIAPTHKIIANRFPNGEPLGRLNDLIADGKGGAYFTVGGLYYAAPDGNVLTIAEDNIRTNGVMLSRNGETLYVTNVDEVLAFDVQSDGSATNRRVFATLSQEGEGFGGDGMAIDARGRLYVTGDAGIYVFNNEGTELGIIPVPRRPITLAFSGPGKKTLYVAAMGAVGPDSTPWETPEGVRNTAMTMYKVRMEATGYKGRPK